MHVALHIWHSITGLTEGTSRRRRRVGWRQGQKGQNKCLCLQQQSGQFLVCLELRVHGVEWSGTPYTSSRHGKWAWRALDGRRCWMRTWSQAKRSGHKAMERDWKGRPFKNTNFIITWIVLDFESFLNTDSLYVVCRSIHRLLRFCIQSFRTGPNSTRTLRCLMFAVELAQLVFHLPRWTPHPTWN